MKKIIFICLAMQLFFVYSIRAQLQVFIVEHNNTTSVYNHLDTALAYAQNDDIIYLPGGIISFSGIIRKGVSLIGAGYNPDSTVATGQTILTPTVKILNGASNFFMTGCYILGNLEIDSSSNILITRSRLGSTQNNFLKMFSNCSAIILKECVISALIDYYHTTTQVSVFNSLIYSRVMVNNAVFENNIFLQADGNYYCDQCVWGPANLFAYSYYGNDPLSTSYYTTNYTVNSTFKNNIIHQQLPASYSEVLTHNIYQNNIFTDTLNFMWGTSNLVNNQYSKPLGSILQNVANITNYTQSDNFHLTTNSPAIGAGVGGTDCGIYGGQNPFKDGGVPFNPHIQQINIGNMTDQNGNLLINIKAAAQGN